MGCVYSVPNDQIFLVERFGKFSHLAQPGFLCIGYPIYTISGKISKRITQLDVAVETKTKDNVFVHLTVSVQYMVDTKKIFEAFYSLASPEEQIKSYVFDVVRAAVPLQKLDEVFESKDDIAIAVKNQLKSVMEQFGYCIVQTLVTDVTPDSRVKAAMNEINASKRNRMAAVERAETEKLLLIKQAEAEAESKVFHGRGIAQKRKAMINGLHDSVMGFTNAISDMNEKEAMDLLLISQYFDSIKDLGAASNRQTIFVPQNPGAISSFVDEARSGILCKKD